MKPHWHTSRSKIKDTSKLPQHRAFANHTSIYAIASLSAYCTDSSKEEPLPFPSKHEQWMELESGGLCQTNSITGFAAKAWLHKNTEGNEELVIAYRGTGGEWLRDCLFGNFVPLSGMLPYNQYHEARAYALKWKQKLSKTHPRIPVVLVGHSLGGGLAEYVQRTLPNSKSITFNTSPNNGAIMSLFHDNKPPIDWVRVYERGEFLSFFRRPSSPDFNYSRTSQGKGLRTSKFDSYINWKFTPNSNPFRGHNIHDHCLSLLKIAAATGNPSALEVIEKLEKRRPTRMLKEQNPICKKLAPYRWEVRQKILTERASGKQRDPKNSQGAFWLKNR